jgi:hypothetical protein
MFTGLRPPLKLLWLTHVIVDKISDSPTGARASTSLDWMAGHTERLRTLLVLGAQNKHIRIDLRKPGFTLNERSRDFMSIGITLVRLFRGTNISSLDHGVDNIPKYDNDISQYLGACRAVIENLARAATNVHVYPDGRQLRITKFRMKMVLGWEDTSSGPAYLFCGGADAWIA